MSVYLDYNASAPINPDVLDYMIEIYKNNVGNADSRTHTYGDKSRSIVELARNQIAAILKIQKDEVFFTSGATESNNISILGLKEYGRSVGKQHIVTTSIEHKSVLESVRSLKNQGFEVDFINPGPDGRVSAEQILEKVRSDTLLVSMQHVNNETGIIQPVKEVGDALAATDVFFHIDSTQSFGKLVDELQSVNYNMMSMSAHKLGGPQGVGALILRKRRYKLPPITPIMFGGQQEHGIRPGTIPVALVAALGHACTIALNEYKENQEKCMLVKKKLVNLLDTSGLPYIFNGNQDYCISNTMNICIKGVSSEALMLSSKEYCGISNGSACNSKSYKPSYVLLAMGLSEDRIDSSIRVSWGADVNIDTVVESFSNLIQVAKGLVW